MYDRYPPAAADERRQRPARRLHDHERQVQLHPAKAIRVIPFSFAELGYRAPRFLEPFPRRDRTPWGLLSLEPHPVERMDLE